MWLTDLLLKLSNYVFLNFARFHNSFTCAVNVFIEAFKDENNHNYGR